VSPFFNSSPCTRVPPSRGPRIPHVWFRENSSIGIHTSSLRLTSFRNFNASGDEKKGGLMKEKSWGNSRVGIELPQMSRPNLNFNVSYLGTDVLMMIFNPRCSLTPIETPRWTSPLNTTYTAAPPGPRICELFPPLHIPVLLYCSLSFPNFLPKMHPLKYCRCRILQLPRAFTSAPRTVTVPMMGSTRMGKVRCS
jgi:hypothetical protein